MYKLYPISAVLLALAAGAPRAAANPRPLPYSYPYATLPEGHLEVEQYLDMTPVRVAREDDDATRAVTSMRYQLETELEYGLSDRLEVALYFVLRQGPSADTPFLRFQGIKQRLRYRFAEAGQWPVDVGVYLEAAEFHNEFEVEEKLLLSRRFGRVSAVVNLWVEQEYYFQERDWKHIYNPTAGVHAELSPHVSLGAEYWVRGRFDSTANDPDVVGARSHHYAGPTFMVQKGEAFLSLGAYARLDNLGDATVVGDSFGRLWVRVLLGFGV